MTREDPPRLGMAMLRRLEHRNEALAGDLVEGYRARRSRVWFWREFLGAILTGAFRTSDEYRQIKLVEFPSWQAPRENYAAKRLQLQTAGLSASPVQGVGGLTIVASVMLITMMQPVLWALLGAGVLCGVAIGVMRVRRGRRHASGPRADLTTVILFNHHAR